MFAVEKSPDAEKAHVTGLKCELAIVVEKEQQSLNER